MSDEINYDRRRFFGGAAMTFAAAQLSLSAAAEAQTALPKKSGTTAVKGGSKTSFASLKQIEARLLNVGNAEAGPAGGQPAGLCPGWPSGISAFGAAAPLRA